MNEDRDNRTERYYQESAWALAERIVELEDEAAEVRAATLREAAEITYKMASDMREGDSEEYPEEWSSREVRDAVNEVGDTLQGLAEEK